ncbi:hypothetical protein LPJ75_001792 [Coemansia sp. RSA 2598]|nr:hypothetical protein LPJ75_001792 [Coemansia sp. RSA 2598]
MLAELVEPIVSLAHHGADFGDDDDDRVLDGGLLSGTGVSADEETEVDTAFVVDKIDAPEADDNTVAELAD